MNLAPVVAVVCVYLSCELASCEQKTFIWTQHPDVMDYYEHLLNEREKCKNAHAGPTVKLFRRIASIGKGSAKSAPRSPSTSPSPPSSDTEPSTTPPPGRKVLRSDNSNCRTTVLESQKALRRALSFTNAKRSHSMPLLPSIPSEEGYRFLRSSSTFDYPKSRRRRPARFRPFSFLNPNTCPFHRKSFIKKMDTPAKQELCDADLVLFAFLDDSIAFPKSEADARNRQMNEVHGGVHPILLRTAYNIHQRFTENIPKKENKNKEEEKTKKKKEKEYVKLGSTSEKKKSDSSTETRKNYVKIFVRTRTEEVLVKAVPCVVHKNRSWSLIDGYAADQYFTVEKYANEEVHQVTGLLDATASVLVEKNQIPLSPENLEKSFRLMQEWIVTSNSRIDLCLLDDIQIFRLCSVVYAAWQQHLKRTVRKFNFLRTFKKDDCMRNIFLKSTYNGGKLVSDIAVTLIPCFVNDDQPAFYITSNEDKNSVFIVTSTSSASPSTTEKDYYLNMLVSNITVLRNVQMQTLLVSYKERSQSKAENEVLLDAK